MPLTYKTLTRIIPAKHEAIHNVAVKRERGFTMSVRSWAAMTLTCALIVFVGVGCDWFSPEAKKAKHRERAISYFEKGQYQEARIEYQNVVQIDPKDADAHYRLGLIYMKLGTIPNLQLAASE